MSDFKEITIKNVEFTYPKVDQIYRYDPHAKREDGQLGRSVTATADEHNAGWNCGFIMDKASATQFWNECKAHFISLNKTNKFGAVHSYRQLEDDRIQFSAKRNAKTSKGAYAKPPAVVDGSQLPLADRAFYSGSTGNIKVTIMPTSNPSKKGQPDEWGITLLLGVVQVKNAIYGGGDDLEGLDNDEPEATEDAFGLPIAKPETPQMSDDLSDIDDEIPF
jgi:hypothetical protein